MNIKKIIALGATAATAASLFVGVVGAPAAYAEDAPPSLSEQVCDLVPGAHTEIGDALAAATAALTAAETAIEETKAALDDALVAYGDSIINWIDAVDNDTAAVASLEQGIMNARFGELVEAAVAWGQALTDRFNADVAAQIADVRGSLVDHLELGLECVPV